MPSVLSTLGPFPDVTEISCRTRLMLHDRDPVILLKLSDFLKECLNKASQAHGSEMLSNALNLLDPTLAAQLQTMLAS